MIDHPAIVAVQWLVVVYFVGLNLGYLLLNVSSLRGIIETMETRATEGLPTGSSGLEPPVSLLVPAFNEEATIVATVLALLQVDYPDFEIIVVNDGSSDRTLEVLTERFALVAFPEAFRVRVPTARVRGVYASRTHQGLRVIDKENGGKADSLNAGINAARYPLFCAIDADSVLQRDSLKRVVQPFMLDSRTVAAGGTIRIVNGCSVSGGFVTETGLPRSTLALFQVVEYLRAFLFGRLGWSPSNALLIISGAFGMFQTATVVEVGGYRTDTVGEDMELVVRLHRVLRARRRDYRIVFVPDPVCWTEAPEDLRTLGRQRIRWQRGLAEALLMNRSLLFNPRAGMVGWAAFPFALLFECFGPIIEVAGYGIMIVALSLGIVSGEALAAFLIVAIGMGVMLSVSAILLEEVSFRIYPKRVHLFRLLLAAVIENAGYRQVNSVWRMVGLWRFARKSKGGWGEMRRSGSWESDDGPVSAPAPRETS